jgi:1,2-diacylglycerol 3-beta-glucosyltransferase
MHFPISQSAALELLSFLIFVSAIFQHLQWRLLVSAAAARATIGAGSSFLQTPVRPEEAIVGSENSSCTLLVVVPAHNEEKLLPACLESLNRSTLCPDRFRILVVADNCTDSTLEVAHRCGVATAVRANTQQTGKAWLLHDLFRSLLHCEQSVQIQDEMRCYPWSAAVIVDADCVVHPQMLYRFAGRIDAGEHAVQGCYSILNPDENWRTKMMCCALALVHYIKPLGRERLEFSETLKGSGMCLDRDILASIPWNGNALAEDLDYSLRLAEKGYRVAYEVGAQLWSPMQTKSSAAALQRRRWEGGRLALMAKAPALYRMGLYCKDRKLKERAFDLLTPPLAELTVYTVLTAGMAGMAALHYKTEGLEAASGAAMALLIIHFMYVMMALSLAQIPRSISRALFFAPVYIVWKLAIKLTGPIFRPLKRWERTER